MNEILSEFTTLIAKSFNGTVDYEYFWKYNKVLYGIPGLPWAPIVRFMYRLSVLTVICPSLYGQP